MRYLLFKEKIRKNIQRKQARKRIIESISLYINHNIDILYDPYVDLDKSFDDVKQICHELGIPIYIETNSQVIRLDREKYNYSR